MNREPSTDPGVARFAVRVSDPETIRAIASALRAVEFAELCATGTAPGENLSAAAKPSSKPPAGNRRALGALRAMRSLLRSISGKGADLAAERREWTADERAAIDAERQRVRIARVERRLVAKVERIDAGQVKP